MPNGYPGDGSAIYARGPNVAPGKTADDYEWNAETRSWVAKNRPGYVYMPPSYTQATGKKGPTGWITNDQYNESYHTGWTPAQILAAVTPFIAGGVGALVGGGAAAVPDIASTSGWAGSGVTGALPSTSLAGAGVVPAAAGTGSGVATAAGAAGAAAKGAGMTFGVKDAIQLAPLLGSLFTKGNTSATPPQNDLMEQLIKMQMSQVQQSQPLRDAVMKMAMGLMPIAYQNNMAVPGMAQTPPMAGPRR